VAYSTMAPIYDVILRGQARSREADEWVDSRRFWVWPSSSSSGRSRRSENCDRPMLSCRCLAGAGADWDTRLTPPHRNRCPLWRRKQSHVLIWE
jgi:hypothetical protein